MGESALSLATRHLLNLTDSASLWVDPNNCINGCSTNGICCGSDGGNLFCFGSHCRCSESGNSSDDVICRCQPGFQGASCEQQVRARASPPAPGPCP